VYEYSMGIIRRICKETEIFFPCKNHQRAAPKGTRLGIIPTQAESMEQWRAMMRDAVRCHFDSSSAPSVMGLHIEKDKLSSAGRLPRDLSGNGLAEVLRRYGLRNQASDR